MKRLLEIRSEEGSRKNKKRVARGTSSGHGKTACRGHKGQSSRSGGGKGSRFEGGQTPLYRRLPKMGTFKNYPFKIRFNVLNVGDLEMFGDGSEVKLQAIKEKFFASSVKRMLLPVKILGGGALNKAITVEANKFSEEAKKKIEQAKGKAIEVK